MKRIILVTGGNRGIGQAIVRGLAQNFEDTILMGCRNLEEGRVIAQMINKNVKAVHLDLSKRENLFNDIDAIKNEFGHVDVLINNAGTLEEDDFIQIPLNTFDEVFRINTIGPYELIRAFVKDMIKNNYGRIVNISSGWGSFGEGLTGPFSYSFTKASLNALTKTIAKDLPTNVKINSMCPGWVKTRMGGESAPRTPDEGASTALWLANLSDNGPSGEFFRDQAKILW